jgi:hypothetical protein
MNKADLGDRVAGVCNISKGALRSICALFGCSTVL